MLTLGTRSQGDTLGDIRQLSSIEEVVLRNTLAAGDGGVEKHLGSWLHVRQWYTDEEEEVTLLHDLE